MEKARLNQALSPVPGYKTSSSGLCIGGSSSECRQPYSKFYMFQFCFRPVSWILKLLCREDNRRQAIWTGWKHQVSILRMPNFTAWQEAEDEDAREARIAKTYKAKTPPVTILPQPFLYQEPSAPFPHWTDTDHRSRLLVCLVQDSVSNFQGAYCRAWCFKDFETLRFQSQILVLLPSRLSGRFGWAPQWEQNRPINCWLPSLPCLPCLPCLGQWSLLSYFGCLYPGGCHRGTHGILTRHGGPWEVIHPDHGGIEPANVSRTDKGKKDRVSSCFLWLLQHFCAATSALACQGTDHPNKIFPQAKQVEKSKSAISCSTRKANTSFWNHSWEWGAVPSYQQGQKNVLSAVDLGECMVACIFGAEKLESWDIDASKIPRQPKVQVCLYAAWQLPR